MFEFIGFWDYGVKYIYVYIYKAINRSIIEKFINVYDSRHVVFFTIQLPY